MLQRNEAQDLTTNPGMLAVNAEARDMLKIEEVLRRAHQIHRQHGGFFGYDFEDWARAWSEAPGRRNAAEAEPSNGMVAVLVPGIASEDSDPCFRFDN